MKCNGKMSYRDFIFPVNPYLINVRESRTVAEQKIPYGGSIVSDMGVKGRIITGEGEFYGSGCDECFAGLKKVFEKGGGGMLYIPSQKPVYALFESLEMMARDVEGVIRYSFRFRESRVSERELKDKVIISDGKHTLWDYSYESKVDIEILRELAPDIIRPDVLIEAGRRIYLC